MPVKLKQIPTLLNVIKQFADNDQLQPIISIIKKTYNNSPVKEAMFPDFDKVGVFCVKTGILKLDGELVRLTDLGKKILDKHEENKPISDDLKQIYAEKCFLESSFANNVQLGLSHFIKENDRFWYPAEKVSTLFSDQEMLSMLYECNILELEENLVVVNPRYTKMIKVEEKIRTARLSQKQIDSQLELMKKVGEIAEEIVLDCEIKRLREQGCIEESKKVQRISQSFANAGFDIKSFDGTVSNHNEYDRFIEVKGSTSKDFDFHWSQNEVKTAEELGERYWLYFIGGIDLQLRKSDQTPIIIQNPFQKILKSQDYNIEVEGYRITKMTIDKHQKIR